MPSTRCLVPRVRLIGAPISSVSSVESSSKFFSTRSASLSSRACRSYGLTLLHGPSKARRAAATARLYPRHRPRQRSPAIRRSPGYGSRSACRTRRRSICRRSASFCRNHPHKDDGSSVLPASQPYLHSLDIDRSSERYIQIYIADTLPRKDAFAADEMASKKNHPCRFAHGCYAIFSYRMTEILCRSVRLFGGTILTASGELTCPTPPCQPIMSPLLPDARPD